MTASTLPLHQSYRPDTSTSRIPSPWVWLARVLWVVLLTPLILYFASSIGPYYGQLVQMEAVGFYDPENWGAENADINAVRESIASLSLTPEAVATYVIVIDILSLIPFVGVSLLLYWRKSDEWVGLLASFVFMGLGLIGLNIDVELRMFPPFVYQIMYAVVAFIWPSLMLLPTIFPDGRFVPRWMRIYPIVLYGLFAVLNIAFPVDSPPVPLMLAVLGMALIGVGSGIYRYMRRSTPLQKQQTKWFLLGMAIWLSVSIVEVLFLLIFDLAGNDLLVYRLISKVLAMSFLLIPIGLGFGLLRYRLWDVDFVINRSLVYGTLTLMLGGLFVAAFFALRALLGSVLGSGQDLVAAVIPAVGITALFNPAQKRLRQFIDRRFYGIKLDYVKAVKEYGGSRKEVRQNGSTRESFGSYTDLSLLGRGGMGEVYRAVHPTLNRSVAIKILPPHVEAGDDAHKRFQREAQTVAGLKHPNIVTLHDVGEQSGQPFMVMEYIDGPDLSAVLKQRGRLPLAEALPLFQDIAAALDYAHSQGIVHRDIKPSNVMVEHITGSGQNRSSRAVLMDFGIAKSYAAGTRLTQSGMIGTLDYISPEQIQGAADVDMQADIYSLGVMAYQVLTGELPFKHNNPGAMVLAHLMQPAPDPRSIVSDLPRASADAIMQAMAKSPAARFATAGAFTAALAEGVSEPA